MEYGPYLTDIVHEPTQAEGHGFDVTVDSVRTVTAPGRIDFGGGELVPAETEPVPTEKREPGDDYGWWTLEAGQYLLEYNESLIDGASATVQARDALRARGATHPTLTVDRLAPVPLSVGGAGLRIKENARVSTVTAIEPPE